MWNQSLNIDVLADNLLADLHGDTDGSLAIRKIKKEMTSISDIDAIKVCQLVCALTSKDSNESVEIVSTTPASFHLKVRNTRPVIKELICEARQSILLTGYSISGHFEEFLTLINSKSKQGIVVELYVNKYESVKSVLADIEHTNRRFFKVYEYAGKDDDRMAALHAKTIVVDGEKTLISSANLSYHGLDANIEIGALVVSKDKAAQVQSIFEELKRQRLFTLISEGRVKGG